MGINCKKLILVLSILVAVYAAAVFAPAYRVPFLYDDTDVIRRSETFNRAVYLRDLFRDEYYNRFGERTYRPVVSLSFFVDELLWGRSAVGCHAHNILLHALVSVAVFALLMHMGARPEWAFFGALVFAGHPVKTDAVALASNREELLAALFFFMSYALYLRNSNASRVVSWLLFIPAVFSKEMASSLPLVLAAHDIYYCDRSVRPGKMFLSRLPQYIPYAAIAALPLLVRYIVLPNPAGSASMPGGTPWESLSVMSTAFMKYVTLLVYPARLCADYVLAGAHSPAAPAGLLFFIALAVYLRKFGRSGGFTLAFFLISLLPVSNIIPFGETMAERYLYIPSFALAIAVAMILDRWNSPRLKYIPAIALVAFLSVLTVQRLQVWQSGESLWMDTTACAPESAEAWMNLGNVMLKKGEPGKALDYYTRVPKCSSDYEEGKYYYNVGLARERTGDVQGAMQAFQLATVKDPGMVEAYFHQGKLFAEAGHVEKGLEYLEHALKANPDNAHSYYVTAMYLLGYYDDEKHNGHAIMLLRKATRLNPNTALYYGALGEAFARMGNIDKAVSVLLRSIRLDPQLLPSYRLLRDIFASTGRREEAQEIDSVLSGLERKAAEK